MRPSLLIVPTPLKLTGKLLFVCLKREWQKSTTVFELQLSLLPLRDTGTDVCIIWLSVVAQTLS